MDDWDGLENRCGGNSTVGSNPTPSARSIVSPLKIPRQTPTFAESANTFLIRWQQPPKALLASLLRAAKPLD